MQRGERGDPVLHRRQPGWIKVDGRSVRAEIGGDLVEEDADLAQPGCELVELGVVPGRVVEPRDRAGHLGSCGSGVVDVAGDCLVRAQRGGDQGLGVSQSTLLDLELVVLGRMRLHLGDLVEPVLQQVELAGPLLGVRAQLVESRLDGPQTPERRAVLPHHLAERCAGERVERLSLRRGPEQPVLVGLAVDRDQLVGDLGQQRGRNGGSAGERPRPALRGERATQYDDALIETTAGVGDRVGDAGAVGNVDARLHARLVVTGADESQVGAVAAQQAEGGDDHRLAGTGLTGDDGESRAELELGGVDDAQRGEREVLPHQSPPVPSARCGTPPGFDDRRNRASR